jgi:protein-S-isoprenylcysteine O-methyltransferase Ste14
MIAGAFIFSLSNPGTSAVSDWLAQSLVFASEQAASSSWSSEIQPQFVISLLRFIFVFLSLGMMWMLMQSTILTDRKRHAAIIAGMIRFLFATTADLLLTHAEVYRYAFDNYLYQGVPIDLQISYACVWGTGLCLLWETAWPLFRPLLFLSVVALNVIWDLWGMHTGYILAGPGKNWQMWNIGLQLFLPALTILFYRLVDENRALVLRSVVYALGYFAVFYFLIPSIILSTSMGEVIFPVAKWRTAFIALALVSIPGAWAAGQFAVSGRGTPLPLDPTSKLIISGPYAFVRNPMQISLIGVAVIWAAATGSLALWIYAGVLVVAIQLLRIHEEDELHRRFGNRYKQYAHRVWLWLPRLWPYEED